MNQIDSFFSERYKQRKSDNYHNMFWSKIVYIDDATLELIIEIVTKTYFYDIEGHNEAKFRIKLKFEKHEPINEVNILKKWSEYFKQNKDMLDFEINALITDNYKICEDEIRLEKWGQQSE